MYRCEEFTALISADLDEMLTPEESEQLREHLESCAECRALARELRIVHDTMCSLTAQAPEGFADGVMDKIRRERALEPAVIPITKNGRKRWYALGGLAAVLALTLWGAGGLHLLPSFGGASGGSAMEAAPAAKDSTIGGQIAASAFLSPSASQPMTDNAADGSAADAGAGAETYGGSRFFSVTAQAPLASAGSGEAALTGTNEEKAAARGALTPLDAAYLVLDAVGGGDLAQTESIQEEEPLTLLAKSQAGVAYQLTYTGLSTDGNQYQFTLLIDGTSTELWNVSTDGTSVGKN